MLLVDKEVRSLQHTQMRIIGWMFITSLNDRPRRVRILNEDLRIRWGLNEFNWITTETVLLKTRLHLTGSSDREESTSPDKTQQRTQVDRKRKRKSGTQGVQNDEGGGGNLQKMSRSTETKKIHDYFKQQHQQQQQQQQQTNSPHRHTGAKSPSPQVLHPHMVSEGVNPAFLINI